MGCHWSAKYFRIILQARTWCVASFNPAELEARTPSSLRLKPRSFLDSHFQNIFRSFPPGESLNVASQVTYLQLPDKRNAHNRELLERPQRYFSLKFADNRDVRSIEAATATCFLITQHLSCIFLLCSLYLLCGS